MTAETVKCPMSWAQCLKYLVNRKQTFSIRIEGDDEVRTRVSSVQNSYNTRLRTISNVPYPDNIELSSKMMTILHRIESAIFERGKTARLFM